MLCRRFRFRIFMNTVEPKRDCLDCTSYDLLCTFFVLFHDLFFAHYIYILYSSVNIVVTSVDSPFTPFIPPCSALRCVLYVRGTRRVHFCTCKIAVHLLSTTSA